MLIKQAKSKSSGGAHTVIAGPLTKDFAIHIEGSGISNFIVSQNSFKEVDTENSQFSEYDTNSFVSSFVSNSNTYSRTSAEDEFVNQADPADTLADVANDATNQQTTTIETPKSTAVITNIAWTDYNTHWALTDVYKDIAIVDVQYKLLLPVFIKIECNKEFKAYITNEQEDDWYICGDPIE